MKDVIVLAVASFFAKNKYLSKLKIMNIFFDQLTEVRNGKYLLDTFGRNLGDTALSCVVEKIEQKTERDNIFRYAEDEFFWILKDVTFVEA